MILSSPYFGIFLTFIAYIVASKISSRIKSPLANTLLITLAIIISFLLIFDIDYETYMNGAQYILIMAGPATVALVVPLYKNIDLLKENLVAILLGVLVGSLVAIFSILILSRLLDLDKAMTVTLLPQSVTTAIAIPLSDSFGGFGSVTAFIVSLRGIIGTVFGPWILNNVGIDEPISLGVSLGTTSHAFGTSKAYEIGEVEGSMSGLSIALAGIITSIILPIFIGIFF